MLDRSIHNFLVLPSRAAWEALVQECGWTIQEHAPEYANGPMGESAYGFENYFQHEDGTREPREGYLVNTEGQLPAKMLAYAAPEPPKNPKAVMLGYAQN